MFKGYVLIDALVAMALFSVAAILFLSSVTSSRISHEQNNQMFQDYLKIEEEISELHFKEWDEMEGEIIEISDNTYIDIVSYEEKSPSLEILDLEVEFHGKNYEFPLSKSN